MILLKKVAAVYLSWIVALTLVGCALNPKADAWKLPNRDSTESAMLIGRLDVPHNKQGHSDGDEFILLSVDFKNRDTWYSMKRGEESFVMDNHYYVVPNIKPGKYYFFGFDQGSVYNFMTDGSTVKDSDLIEVKPGEIKYVGSLDYIKNDRSFFEKVKGTGTYSLSKATHPTELEMLQWLMQTAKGSGWEADIKKRMHELGK